MKRLRLDRWASSLQPPRNPRILRCPYSLQSRNPRRELQQRGFLLQHQGQNQRRPASSRRRASTVAAEAEEIGRLHDIAEPAPVRERLNSPSHRKALCSSKLSALHARLALPSKLPLQTLARCLVDPSVDPRPGYNNQPLSILGQDLLGYYTAEWLLCTYPRLPMPIVFAAQHAYVGDATLGAMRAEWGVEAVAAPGSEVDAGLLQLKRVPAGNAMAEGEMRLVKDAFIGHGEKVGETGRKDMDFYRRGTSSRIVFDDQFGELHTFQPSELPPYAGAPISTSTSKPAEVESDNLDPTFETPKEDMVSPSNQAPTSTGETEPTTLQAASAGFIRALCGSLYLHAGTEAARVFHKAHVLSRHLPLHTLFHFSHPTRDLSRLCARENFEPPMARLISESGRLSRTPVFVVGVFSGDDKLGEAAGSSLNEARVRASAAALRGWYLYSPAGDDIKLPSSVEGDGEKQNKWKSQMVDPGEVIT